MGDLFYFISNWEILLGNERRMVYSIVNNVGLSLEMTTAGPMRDLTVEEMIAVSEWLGGTLSLAIWKVEQLFALLI